MTVYDAINRAVALRPSEVSTATMLMWLTALDGKIWTEIISQYEDPTRTCMPYYDADDNTPEAGTVLFAEEPYDLLYVDYLVMRIDLENDDYERYNNRAVMFNAEYREYVDWYNREHVHSKRITDPGQGRWATWLQF